MSSLVRKLVLFGCISLFVFGGAAQSYAAWGWLEGTPQIVYQGGNGAILIRTQFATGTPRNMVLWHPTVGTTGPHPFKKEILAIALTAVASGKKLQFWCDNTGGLPVANNYFNGVAIK